MGATIYVETIFSVLIAFTRHICRTSIILSYELGTHVSGYIGGFK